ncbi:MAG: cobyric acid synthase [Jatrophihabitantaceae bacterium]
MLIAGTGSGVGKSAVVAGLCRWLAREGVSVAPFKAQNMSLNSFVTRDGAEIGRAQAAQAAAAGIESEAAMNPVLLKPGSDTRSQLIVLGRAVGERDATAYWGHQDELLEVVVEAYRDLRRRFDVVICEGAGSPAEINLRATDIVNLGFARAADMPVVVIGDIDPGGVFASLLGTLVALDAQDQALIAGFLINRFRGDRTLLEPGLTMLAGLTGRPTYGVLPYLPGLAVDAEDAIDARAFADPAPPHGADILRVHVVTYPRISNHTDVDALASEPGVLVRFATRPEELADADLVVLPGTRATVDDLGWLRGRGFEPVLAERARRGGPILGICGGYQLLGEVIDDRVESGRGRVLGLGLLPVRTAFSAEKTLGRPSTTVAADPPYEVHGYEIHHGQVVPHGGEPFVGGCRNDSVAGTMWHGLLENDRFRRSYLVEVARQSGRAFTVAPDTSFAAVREARLDRLADLVAEHADTAALRALIDGGPPPRPTLRLSLG